MNSPREAPRPRIFHVDNSSDMRRALKMSAEQGLFDVALSVANMAQALSCIPNILIQYGIDVALLNGTINGQSGELIAKEIRRTMTGLSVVSFSMEEGIKWGDENILKGVSLDVLERTILKVSPLEKPRRI